MIRKIVFLSLITVMGIFPVTGSVLADSCVVCHANRQFMVTNKKLYDYYQRWRISTHAQEDVACDDCHGGNPQGKTKLAAHGKSMSASDSHSATNFKNIPETCGACHDDKLAAYRQSLHYKKMKQKKQEQKGPNCVTCHGSLNATALNVNTVRNVCIQCHNAKTKNHPGIPNKAVSLLNDFNAIRGYVNYIRRRAPANQLGGIMKKIEPMVEGLSNQWHTFDLDKVAPQTKGLLEIVQQERKRIRALNKKK